MLLMIDNYDSFTYNLVQYLGELGEDVKVYRNDEITLEEVGKLKPAHIVISPGPCTPGRSSVEAARSNASWPRSLPRAPRIIFCSSGRLAIVSAWP